MSITHDRPTGPWTLDGLDSIPDNDLRFEIHEGTLVVLAPVVLWHARVARRIANALESSGRVADVEVGVRGSARDTRVADVAVFRGEPSNLQQAHWAPEELELVVEVVSAESRGRDRYDKPHWYAAEGIPAYWRVETGETAADAVIFQHSLARTADGSSAYVESGVTTLSALEEAVS
jgi:Uma2 family endonuclease